MAKPLALSNGTILQRSAGGVIRKTAASARTWMLQNSVVSSTSATTDWVDGQQAVFHGA